MSTTAALGRRGTGTCGAPEGRRRVQGQDESAQPWQTDFTYLKLIGYGWFDDFLALFSFLDEVGTLPVTAEVQRHACPLMQPICGLSHVSATYAPRDPIGEAAPWWCPSPSGAQFGIRLAAHDQDDDRKSFPERSDAER
ncbi:hypothetical protein IE4872_CH02980 [Rhizobium gallicum]|uniref:Uncharacterized protein n=1 Tax=Rhizobium gallicum TaxID=56730 RepID=A0A1L5NL35_9HYPH|nr:hypothetical protein IE4872_CH02980 [Rhizobium gallicum]